MKRFILILKLIGESFFFAFNEVLINKTRTILSLLGITIGIFSIISVFTVFDSMENSIKSEIESLGDNVLFIQKWPWAMGSDYPWWKYYKRPEPQMADLREIQKRSTAAAAAAFMVAVNRTVKYRNNSIENVNIMAVTQDYDVVMPFDLQEGRYFTPIESKGGDNVAIIGSLIAKNLFGEWVDPVGEKMKIFGLNLDVIGVLKEEGEDLFGNTSDNQVIIPVNFARNAIDIRDVGSTIVVRAKDEISNDQLKDELTGILRSVHKLKPTADNDFAINETDIISKGFDQLFAVIAMVGWVIGGFSLLVGGFGIANIMFVSVKERTRQIGIQKSLGAKNYFILLQFLFEAVFLSIFGGIIGLFIVFVLTLGLSSVVGFDLILTEGNILLGILVSAFIGLVSGFIPAFNASRLNPVDAMRSTF
ncbi:MAG: ABC transporter permease [Bacteroidota bacterium]|nr:ABC transporter permease [Bacteroidota bacterium]